MLRLGAVGDVARTLPAARALRRVWPDAHLAWLVEPAAAELLGAQSWLDEVLVFPRPALSASLGRFALSTAAREARHFVRRLRDQRFDVTVDFHSILRSGVLAALSGAPVRIGYARPFGRELAPLLATHRARLGERRMSRFRRNDALVAFLGGELSSDPRPVDLDPAALARMQRVLPRAGRVVVVHAGSSERTPHKRYDALGYARVARELAGNDGATVLVARGPGGEERIRAERIVAAAGGAARLAPETPEITDLAALLSLSDLVIAADSGPLHLAALVGTPVVQILGPTDPVENAPFPLAEARILRANLPCSPCRRGCAEASCMRAIVPGQVVAAARDLLGKSSSSEIAGVAG